MVSMALFCCGSNHISAVDTSRLKASAFTIVSYGIPQGSVLGSILLIMYTPDLMKIIERHGLLPHLFADDTQVYSRCSLSGMNELASACLSVSRRAHITFWIEHDQQTATQRIQDRTNLVCQSEASSSTSGYSDQRLLYDNFISFILFLHNTLRK